MRYEIVKTFTGGVLEGLTITERTNARFSVGHECRDPHGTSPYRIDAVRELPMRCSCCGGSLSVGGCLGCDRPQA